MNDAYTQGFVDKCAELGVDPSGLLKSARPARIPDAVSQPKPVRRVNRHVKGAFRKLTDIITDLNPRRFNPPPRSSSIGIRG